MRIAVIGAGIAGLGATWLLSRHHHVTLYEKNSYLGGHANTAMTKWPDGSQPVDTGFIVLNDRNYPNLNALFNILHVPIMDTEMSFSVSTGNGAFEYGGGSLAALVGQPSNLLKPRFYGLIREVLRFYKEAPQSIGKDSEQSQTLGEYLNANGYSDAFRNDHILPMAAAIWSSPINKVLDFPLQTFLTFFKNHGLLSLNDRPQWKTVSGGSKSYIERLIFSASKNLEIAFGAAQVRSVPGGVEVMDAGGDAKVFDEVVIACHADEALALLDKPTDRKASILGAFRYQANEAVLHSDEKLMPKRKSVWSSWNYLGDGGSDSVALTYWMNRLQHIPEARPLFVTLNPFTQPDPKKVHGRYSYEHPIFDAAAIDAQSRFPEIQGVGGLWFCGAYQRYGFHEDGLRSAVAVAQSLGVTIPWEHDVPPATTNERRAVHQDTGD